MLRISPFPEDGIPVDLSREESIPQRTEGNESDSPLHQRRDDFLFGLPPHHGIFTLQCSQRQDHRQGSFPYSQDPGQKPQDHFSPICVSSISSPPFCPSYTLESTPGQASIPTIFSKGAWKYSIPCSLTFAMYCHAFSAYSSFRQNWALFHFKAEGSLCSPPSPHTA